MAKNLIVFGKIVKIILTVEGGYFCLQPLTFLLAAHLMKSCLCKGSETFGLPPHGPGNYKRLHNLKKILEVEPYFFAAISHKIQSVRPIYEYN